MRQTKTHPETAKSEDFSVDISFVCLKLCGGRHLYLWLRKVEGKDPETEAPKRKPLPS